ncbi:cellulose binding domain-containing protein, partial [Micromonospora sp. DH14]
WQGGFGANVTITNLGDAVTGWTLTWRYDAGQTVTQAWNATVTQSGAAVTAKNVGYNGALPTNGVVSFGFNGSWTGSNPAPGTFA